MPLKNVLIVDDEEDLTWSISKHLSKDKDSYTLHAVNSASDALDLLKKTEVELVISDIRMPQISGLDLLLKVRELYPETKVIIMTAYGSSEIQDEANKRGCFKYIEKPFEINELRQMILDNVKEKKGFEGRISDFQLSDLIQMNCLGRLTNAINVETAGQNGTIYFEDGNIVHAKNGKLVGEDAFYEILSWQGGSFAINKREQANEETIFKGWQSLMLEGLRRKDEEAEQEVDPEQQLRTEISTLLDQFLQAKGIHLLMVFDEKGKLYEHKVREEYKDEYEIELLAEQVEKLMAQEAELAAVLNRDEKREFTIEYENGLFKLTWLPDSDMYLLLLADHTANFGLLRIETKKNIRTLGSLIENRPQK